jgi:hypothetical protein
MEKLWEVITAGKTMKRGYSCEAGRLFEVNSRKRQEWYRCRRLVRVGRKATDELRRCAGKVRLSGCHALSIRPD